MVAILLAKRYTGGNATSTKGHLFYIYGRHVYFLGGHPWETTHPHPQNPPSSVPTTQKGAPVCSFMNSASICIRIKTWNISDAELSSNNWDTDAHAHMTYQAPTTGLHSPGAHIASISSEFYWLSHAGTLLEVWSELLHHWLDSPRGLHPSACAFDG